MYPPTRKQIDSYSNLSTYTWQEFLALLIEMFVYIPCLLCGEIHELRIHALLWRKIRSPEEVSNTDIIIIAIICLSAKKLGKQYTKRLLPPFVIPYCVINREAVLAYLRQFPDGITHVAIASEMMGTVDIRTIRRHVLETKKLIEDAALRLSEFLSAIAGYGELPDHRLGQSSVESLDKAAKEMDRAAARVQGGSAPRIPPMVYVHAVGVYARAGKRLIPPLSLVLRAVVFHDTS